jgi:hypothetical protein
MNLKLFFCVLFFSRSAIAMQYPVAPTSCPEIKIEIHAGKLTPKEIVPTDIIEDCGHGLRAPLCDGEYALPRYYIHIAACGAWGCLFGSAHASVCLASLAALCACMTSEYTDSKVYLRKRRYDKYVQLMEEGTVDQYRAALIAKQYWPEREKRN